MSKENILEVKNLKKSFINPKGEPIDILKNISFSLKKGTATAILGHSGSGKSTLLSLISGLERADSGEIWIDNKDITDLDEKSLSVFRSQKIGIVFQHFYLMSHLNALENISLPLELSQKKGAFSKAEELLRNVGLYDRKDHFPKQLSGGEMQRVAIARAISLNPPLLIADEPTGNLDPKTSENLSRFLFELIKTQQMTMLLVTHNLDLAKKCDHIISLENGNI